MSTLLFDNLLSETVAFTDLGSESLHKLMGDCDGFLNELKLMETLLEKQLNQEENGESTEIFPDHLGKLEKSSNNWYKKSITHLKTYNTGINKFQKNILNNSKYKIDLDEAYTYPLNLNNFPVNYKSQDMLEDSMEVAANIEKDMKTVKLKSHEELMKAIIIHLLKIGQCDLVKDMVNDIDPEGNLLIDETLLQKFKLLNEIVDDIVVKHDLSRVLGWFREKYNKSVSEFSGLENTAQPTLSKQDEIEFKFHMLQFTLLLNGENPESTFNKENVLSAYLYAKENFSRFFKDYLHDISPLMTLLLFKTSNNNNSENYMSNILSEFIDKMRQAFNADQIDSKGKHIQSQFVGEILFNFERIHDNHSIFVNLSNEFISDYCKDLKLSNDSSIFQSILAGFISLPSFYKYNKIQMKLNKVSKGSRNATTLQDTISPQERGNANSYQTTYSDSTYINFEAPYNYDLPFQLPDSNKFLFNYHSIFICPVSKEQFIPLTADEDLQHGEEHKKKKKKVQDNLNSDLLNFMHNPVVVLKFCQHLALRDSVWHLSKKGTEIFKCHYCYKKHKFSDVTDAYFIDL